MLWLQIILWGSRQRLCGASFRPNGEAECLVCTMLPAFHRVSDLTVLSVCSAHAQAAVMGTARQLGVSISNCGICGGEVLSFSSRCQLGYYITDGDAASELSS
jgi:hypothetical protein